MKNETTFAKKFAGLFKKIKGSHTVEPPPERDPVTQMVVGFLEWNASRKSAADAHHRLMKSMVDNNDLRVSHPHEIVALIGERYPQAEERAARMHEALQEIFIREHAVSLESQTKQGKKQVRTYFDTLPGMTPYVAAQVTLVSFGGTAIPVDDHLVELFREEEAVDPDASIEDIEAFLHRHIKADDVLEAHLLLRAWEDAHGGKGGGGAKKPTKKPAKKK